MSTATRRADESAIERPVEAARAQPSSEFGGIAKKIAFLALLLFFTMLFIYPLVWLFSASLKPGGEVFTGDLVGSRIAWENYPELFNRVPVALWGWNSLYTSFLAAITVTFSSALVAFAFAYFRFPGRDILFGVVLASMMLPGAVTMIPTYLIWDFLGFNNTHVPLWAGNLFASPFYIFLMRQFFLTLPRDLFDAAKVDGAGYIRMWWSVAVPLTRAALIVVFVFELKAAWTDLVRPLIFLRDPGLFTLPRGLKATIDSPSIGGEQHFELLAVGGVLVMLPMIIVFFLGQRYFIEGIATSGSTGR